MDKSSRMRAGVRRVSLLTLLALVPAASLANSELARTSLPATDDGQRARALLASAVALEHGEGVAKDPLQAAAMYCEAARIGDPEAMYALGWMYANGRGLPRDDAHASALFAMAAERGHGHARGMLRFTGSDVAVKPDCLAPRPFADDPDALASRIARLSRERREIAQLVMDLAEEYQVSPGFALAIATTESALNPAAVSPKNAMGVMQLIPDTAARFNVSNVFDPRENIKGGLAYLRWLLAYFEGDIALAAAAYNAGEGAVNRYRGIPPYKETQAYVERILNIVQYRQHPFDGNLVEPSPMLSAIRLAAHGEDD